MAAISLGNYTQPGEDATTSANATELFLQKYGGEVAESYKETLVVMPRVRVRTLRGGKSATFGAVGNATAGYHTAGTRFDEDAQLSEIDIGERVISLDRPMFHSTFIDSWEEMVNHYDVRGPVTRSQGHALGKLTEQNLMALLAKGGDATAGAITDQPGGNDMVYANAGTNGADYVQAIEDQVQYWDENDVPQEGRFGCVPPAQYRLLVDQTDFHSIDLGNSGNGSLMEGSIGRVRGVTILKSNLVPSTDTSGDAAPTYAGTGQVNDYRVDCSDCIGVFGTPRSLGVVSLMGVKIETQKDIMLGGTIFKASKAIGANILRESDCGVLRTAVVS